VCLLSAVASVRWIPDRAAKKLAGFQNHCSFSHIPVQTLPSCPSGVPGG
jgi:hypothetical protein